MSCSQPDERRSEQGGERPERIAAERGAVRETLEQRRGAPDEPAWQELERRVARERKRCRQRRLEVRMRRGYPEQTGPAEPVSGVAETKREQVAGLAPAAPDWRE